MFIQFDLPDALTESVGRLRRSSSGEIRKVKCRKQKGVE